MLGEAPLSLSFTLAWRRGLRGRDGSLGRFHVYLVEQAANLFYAGGRRRRRTWRSKGPGRFVGLIHPIVLLPPKYVVRLTDAYRLRLRKSKDRHTCIQVSHCMKHKMEMSGVGTRYPGGESPL